MSALSSVIAILAPFERMSPDCAFTHYRVNQVVHGVLLVLADDDTEAIQYVIDFLRERRMLVEWALSYAGDFPREALGRGMAYNAEALYGEKIKHPESDAIRRLLGVYRPQHPVKWFSFSTWQEVFSVCFSFPDIWLTAAYMVLGEETQPLKEHSLRFSGVSTNEIPPYEGQEAFSSVQLLFQVLGGENRDIPLPVELGVTYYYNEGSFEVYFAKSDYSGLEELANEYPESWHEALSWFDKQGWYLRPDVGEMIR